MNSLCLFELDVNVNNLNGRTAMTVAFSNGHVAIVKLLRNAKASISAEDCLAKGSVMEEVLSNLAHEAGARRLFERAGGAGCAALVRGNQGL